MIDLTMEPETLHKILMGEVLTNQEVLVSCNWFIDRGVSFTCTKHTEEETGESGWLVSYFTGLISKNERPIRF